MPKVKQVKLPETAVLSIEDIRKLLTPAQKKKNNLKEKTEEQKAAMLIRMKNMREKSLESRNNKKNAIQEPIEKPHLEKPQIQATQIQQDESFILFEKKYNSKMEKLDDTMSQINTSLNEINQRKKEKYEKKFAQATPQTQATPIIATPIIATPIIATPIIATPVAAIPNNPNRVMKSTFNNNGPFNKR